MLDKSIQPIAHDDTGIWFKLAALQNAADPLNLLLLMARNAPGCIPLQMGSQRVFVVTAPDYFKQVLATKSANYSKYLDGMKPIFGASMITLDGALWQQVRAVEQPAFHPDALATYVPHFLAAIHARLERWRGLDGGATLDIGPETWALACDMICRALFRRETPFNPALVYNAIDAYTDVTNHRALGKFSDADVKAGPGTQTLHGGEAIARACEAWNSLPALVLAAPPFQNHDDYLLRMIEVAAADPAIEAFDHTRALDEIKQYIWAGTETTALVLGWALYICATKPEIAQLIRDETAAVFGDRDPTLADYQMLLRTRSVIAETMRAYPPIWSLARRAEADDVIGDQDIKAGDVVSLWLYVVQNDPRHWDNPERFDPDRFGTGAKAPAPYSYLPFGAGRRACIGTSMSQIEMALALALILRDFDLDYAGEAPAGVKLSVVLAPDNRLPMRMRPRA